MRIVHLIPTLKMGGAERFAIDITVAQRRLPSVEAVRLLVMYDASSARGYASYEGNDFGTDATAAAPEIINSYYHPSITKRSVVEIEGYRRIIETFDPHVIHTHLFRAELLSATFLSRRALYVTHCHDNMVEFEPLSLRRLSKRALTNSFERSLLRVMKYRKVRPFFVANSRHTYDYFRRVLPAALRNRVELIPHGFQFSRFFDADRSPRAHPGNEVLKLTMVGSLLADPKKNQEFLIEVAACLKRDGRPFQLSVIGDGPRRPALEALARARGVDSHVRFCGFVSKVEEALWQADVYVHSATYEPFGLVFLEAMAAGLPCVALDGKGNRDVIRDGYNGHLVPAPDPVEFAARIMDVAGNAAGYATMSRNAIATAREFDIGRCAEELVSFYRSRIAAGATAR